MYSADLLLYSEPLCAGEAGTACVGSEESATGCHPAAAPHPLSSVLCLVVENSRGAVLLPALDCREDNLFSAGWAE